MSSFVSHALVGASCLVLAKPQTARRALPLLFITGLLGMSPDVDYLLIWLVDWQLTPRITHSIGFVLLVAFFAWGLCRFFFKDLANFRLLLALCAAASSHLLLDVLVGTTRKPFLWPLTNEGFVLPMGLLPSAGKLDLWNYYFWRNLLIELGILLPVLIFTYALLVRNERSWASWRSALGLIVLSVSLYISISLSR